MDSFPAQALESAIFFPQGMLVSFSGKWYLEIEIWPVDVVVAIGLSLVPGLFGGKN